MLIFPNFVKIIGRHQKALNSSVAEPHHFYAAPDPAALAPNLLYSKEKILKRTTV
jgi:hypothetical protein